MSPREYLASERQEVFNVSRNIESVSVRGRAITKSGRLIYEGAMDVVPLKGWKVSFPRFDIEASANAYSGPFDVLDVRLSDQQTAESGRWVRHVVLVIGPDY